MSDVLISSFSEDLASGIGEDGKGVFGVISVTEFVREPKTEDGGRGTTTERVHQDTSCLYKIYICVYVYI